MTLTKVVMSFSVPDCFAEVRNACTFRVNSHCSKEGPPGATQAVCTARAANRLIVSSTVFSIAANCPTAPSGVRGKPDGIFAGPK